jgi:hypothetical protein
MASLIPLQNIPEDCVPYAIFKQPQQDKIVLVVTKLLRQWLFLLSSQEQFSLEDVFSTHPRLRILDENLLKDTILENISHSSPEICAVTALTFNHIVITQK